MRNSILSVLLSVAWFSLGSATAFATEITQPKGVVELFTSQGCSSCPAADKVLGKLAGEGNILALSWHVDYWDYLGWKDSFASPVFSERQRRYAASMKQRQVFTPQAIINGQTHVIGSREKTIRALVNSQDQSGAGLSVSINAAIAGDNLKISIPSSAQSLRATLWLVYYNNRNEVDIQRGENSGRKIIYHNVVGDMQMLGMVKTTGLEVELPVSEMQREGYDSCALLLQTTDKSGNPARIIGAAIISDI